MRYFIQTDLNPFSTAAMDQVNTIIDTAKGAQPNTSLADASISMSGYPVMLRDIRDYYERDMRLIVAVTVVVVILILMALLRAIVAPLYLVGSVVISYMSAIGLGVVVFQVFLGQELHWSVPGLAFVVLVAVGADYNMLLASRLRDESALGVRSSVIRTALHGRSDHGSGSDICRFDVRPAVLQHRNRRPRRLHHWGRDPDRHVRGADHHRACHGHAARTRKLVARTPLAAVRTRRRPDVSPDVSAHEDGISSRGRRIKAVVFSRRRRGAQ